MASKKFSYEPIYPGFPWKVTLNLVSTPALFPEGVKLRAQLRVDVDQPVLAVLTTDNGAFTRIDDSRIEVTLSELITAKLKPGTVLFDLVRTDTPVARHLGVRVQVTVKTSATTPR